MADMHLGTGFLATPDLLPVLADAGRIAVHESPHGRIESAWELAHDTLTLRVTVPPGATAEVVLPDGRTEVAGPGPHTYTSKVPTHHRIEVNAR